MSNRTVDVLTPSPRTPGITLPSSISEKQCLVLAGVTEGHSSGSVDLLSKLWGHVSNTQERAGQGHALPCRPVSTLVLLWPRLEIVSSLFMC